MASYEIYRYVREPGYPLHTDWKRVAADQWNHEPELLNNFSDFQHYYRMYSDSVRESSRIEYLVYEDGRLSAGLILSPCIDYHYGTVVVPQVCRVITGQNDRALAKVIIEAYKDACGHYNTLYYQTMKHTGINTHTITTRTVHY